MQFRPIEPEEIAMCRFLVPLALLLGLAACGTAPSDRTEGGAATGAAAGAGVGIIGGPVGMVVGALVGGGAGAITGATTTPQQVDLGQPIWNQ